ncbi:MAG: HAD family phosphatase [Protaetiibacter sp.]
MRAVIFDMDGVLFDSEPVYLDIMHDYLVSLGAGFSKSDLNFIVGSSSRTVYDELERRSGGVVDASTVRAGMIERAEAARIDYARIVEPHARELLERLRGEGFVIGLASSATRYFIDLALDSAALAGYFDVVVSGEQFRESKPNPEIYLHTLGELGVAAREALVVEDSSYGIEAAVRAGIRVAAVRDRRFGIDQSAADFRIDGLHEVWPLVEALTAETRRPGAREETPCIPDA